MPRFCFVHAADLHLDTPFACHQASSPDIAEALREATFQAFDRVISACLENDAAFLLVAGDVFDAAQKSLRAQLRFFQGLERLASRSIPVFVAHGNHDPLDSCSASLRPPANTHVFGPEVETREVRRRDELLATVTGVSHPGKSELRNLARLFPPPTPGRDVFSIALLHCNVGAKTGHEPYAPCELDDLSAAGYHYWALGHAHERRLLLRSPCIAYSGNTQGRSLREAGPRGCFLVEVDQAALAAEPRFLETDAIRWLSADLDAEPFSTTSDLLNAAAALCRTLPGRAGGRPVVARLTVHGRTPLYSEFRRPGYAADLARAIRDAAASCEPFVCLADLSLALQPPLDLEARQNQPDFLGDLLRLAGDLPDSDCRQVWEPLLEHPGISRYQLRAVLEDLDPREILLQARALCADLLSPGDAP